MFKTIYLFFFSLVIAFVGCDLSDSGFEQSTNYLVEVERIEAPDTVASDESFSIRLLGEIGPDGCHSLQEVATASDSDSMAIEVVGLQEVDSNESCSDGVVELDETVEVEPPLEDPFVITVFQPTDTSAEPNTLVDTVRVQ